jgi:hypothetical protein
MTKIAATRKIKKPPGKPFLDSGFKLSLLIILDTPYRLQIKASTSFKVKDDMAFIETNAHRLALIFYIIADLN